MYIFRNLNFPPMWVFADGLNKFLFELMMLVCMVQTIISLLEK